VELHPEAGGVSFSQVMANTVAGATRLAISVMRCGLPPFKNRRSLGSVFSR
jgi:hypothetical protein